MDLTLEASLDDLATIREFIDSACGSYNIDSDIISDIRLAVDEAVTNVIEHGYGGSSGALEIRVDLQGSDIVIRIHDSASTFNPLEHNDVCLDSPLKKQKPGGYGIFIIKKIMDEVDYIPTPERGNILQLVKKNVL